MCLIFQTTRTTFWTRHDRIVSCDDGMMKNGGKDVVTEAVETTPHGKRLEMSLLVRNNVATVSENADEKCCHQCENGIRPECMCVVIVNLICYQCWERVKKCSDLDQDRDQSCKTKTKIKTVTPRPRLDACINR